MHKSRADNVLETKIVLINLMKKDFNVSWNELSTILEKYSILPYIDVAYEQFNSMGEGGILLEIRDFIKEQGGSI